MFVDSFSSLNDLKGKDRRSPIKILAALEKVGRFSCFEVDDILAKPLTAVLQSDWVTTKHNEIVKDADGYGSYERSLYPWTYVTLTESGRATLRAANAALQPISQDQDRG